jgi:hypothetical protein
MEKLAVHSLAEAVSSAERLEMLAAQPDNKTNPTASGA